jgi:hypothetical protein
MTTTFKIGLRFVAELNPGREIEVAILKSRHRDYRGNCREMEKRGSVFSVIVPSGMLFSGIFLRSPQAACSFPDGPV